MAAITPIHGILRFFEQIGGSAPTESKNSEGQLFQNENISVLLDWRKGVHVQIRRLPSNLDGAIKELNQFAIESKILNSLWIEVWGASSANVLKVIPDSWTLGDPNKGNIIVEKDKIRVWQWFASEKCTIPPGATHQLGGTAAVIDLAAQKILLVKNHRRGGWNLPGGTFDPKLDRNTSETAIRETLEETGIQLTGQPKLIAELCFPYNPFAPSINYVWQFVMNEAPQIAPQTNDRSVAKAQWISFEDVEKGKMDEQAIGPEIKIAIKINQGFSCAGSFTDRMYILY